MNRLRLILSFISATGLLVSCASNAQQVNLSADEFEKAIEKPGAQILDVRTAGEFETGHIKNSFLANWNNETEFKERVSALDKSKPVYTYCLAGPRSSAATAWLNKNGFKAYNLIGGANAWKKAGKPLEQALVVEQMSLADYEATIPKDKTVLVDIGAQWCPPCKKMLPIIDSLAAAGKGKFVLVKIDGGQQTEICKQLNIDGFPTFIIYKQGKEFWRKQGILDAKELSKHL
ncbi:MAG: thioredoxin domain-containing protein [Chitinophagaceae bacterium]